MEFACVEFGQRSCQLKHRGVQIKLGRVGVDSCQNPLGAGPSWSKDPYRAWALAQESFQRPRMVVVLIGGDNHEIVVGEKHLFDNALGRVANHNDCLNITLVCCRAVAGESFVERGLFCFDQVLFKFCVVKEPLEPSWRGNSPKHGEVRMIVIRKHCDST